MRFHTSLRRLAGLAVVGLAAIAPAPALAHGGGAVFTRDERERQRRPGLRAGRRRHAHARCAAISPAAPERVRPASAPRARSPSSAAGCSRSTPARTTSRPSACAATHLVLVNRVPSGGTTPNSVTIHDGIAYVLNSGGTGNISGFKLAPPRPRAAERLHAAALARRRPAPCRSRSRRAATSSSSRRRAPTRSSPTPSTAGAVPEPAPLTPRPAPRRSASRSASTTRCS